MFKALGSAVALTVFALPLVPQAALSQQAVTQPSSTFNNSLTDTTPVTGTAPVTGVNSPANQNLGAGTAGTVNRPLNQTITPGTPLGNLGNPAIAPIQLQVVPGQAVVLQIVSPTAGETNENAANTNLGNADVNQAPTGSNAGNAGANQAPRTTATISPGGVLNLSTATSDRPTAGNVRNTGGNVQNLGVGNQATGTTNNVLNTIQPVNPFNGNNTVIQGANLNPPTNQAFVARGTLDAPLQQAVCAQNWQQATSIVNRAIAAAPVLATQYRSQLEAYRDQLQTLDAANVRVPNWQQRCGG